MPKYALFRCFWHEYLLFLPNMSDLTCLFYSKCQMHLFFDVFGTIFLKKRAKNPFFVLFWHEPPICKLFYLIFKVKCTYSCQKPVFLCYFGTSRQAITELSTAALSRSLARAVVLLAIRPVEIVSEKIRKCRL